MKTASKYMYTIIITIYKYGYTSEFDTIVLHTFIHFLHFSVFGLQTVLIKQSAVHYIQYALLTAYKLYNDVFALMFVKSLEQYNMFYYFRMNVKHVFSLPYEWGTCSIRYNDVLYAPYIN